MTEPAYPAARAAAGKVHPHFAQHFLATDLEPDTLRDILPDVETIEAIIDVAFWASLRREEIYTPRISLAFVGPGQVDVPLMLERPVVLASQPLTRLGPAVERPGIHLCVCRRSGDLLVWGASRNLPPHCFVLEVIGPGLLVIKQNRGDESGKFLNVAVLQGEEIKIIDQNPASAPDRPELITSLLGLQSQPDLSDSANALIQLAVSMRAHGKGGSLLVVPAATNTWQQSVLHPITYSVAPPFCALGDLMRGDHLERSRRRWQEALRRVVDGIAGLTAVDGATVITDQYALLAFGAKIVQGATRAQVGSVTLSEPLEGSASVVVEPGQLGGTRHLSAAQFVHDQRDSIALVASQDGRFTVFGWSGADQMVYAIRIETLLL